MPHAAGPQSRMTGPRRGYPLCHLRVRPGPLARGVSVRVFVMLWIDLEGAVNVRALGGLPTDDGGQTVTGRLLRADNLQELSPSDVTRLVRDLGLTTVVDLRSSAELASEGPAPLDDVPGVRHTHHPGVPESGLG